MKFGRGRVGSGEPPRNAGGVSRAQRRSKRSREGTPKIWEGLGRTPEVRYMSGGVGRAPRKSGRGWEGVPEVWVGREGPRCPEWVGRPPRSLEVVGRADRSLQGAGRGRRASLKSTRGRDAPPEVQDRSGGHPRSPGGVGWAP